MPSARRKHSVLLRSPGWHATRCASREGLSHAAPKARLPPRRCTCRRRVHRLQLVPRPRRAQVAVRFAAALGAVEVIYLGVLWQVTGDLSAPLVAAIW